MLIISDIVHWEYITDICPRIQITQTKTAYKKGCPRALVTYIFVFSHSQI